MLYNSAIGGIIINELEEKVHVCKWCWHLWRELEMTFTHAGTFRIYLTCVCMVNWCGRCLSLSQTVGVKRGEDRHLDFWVLKMP